MKPAEILERVRISEVWTALGGDTPRQRRAAAFWRETKDRNVALNDDKGTWYDHARGEGGGILDLIQRARGGSRQEATRWLSERFALPLDDHEWSEAERAEWGRQRRAAEDEAREFVWWKRDLLEVLRCERDQLLQTYHGAGRFLRTHSIDECEAAGDWRWELAFDVQYSLWPKVEDLQSRIDLLERASWEQLLPYFRRSKEQRAAA